MGLKWVMGMMFSVKRISVYEVYDFGLVNEVVVLEMLEDVVFWWCSDILKCVLLFFKVIKEVVL